MRLLAIVAVFVMAVSISAHAQTVEETFQKFGLLGIWASACNQPPDLDSGNPHTIYAVSSSGEIILTYDFGTKRHSAVYTIVSAVQTGSDRVSYTEERFPDKARLNVTVIKAKDKISVLSSVAQNGKAFIENGKIVGSGQPSQTQTRCY
jgi:hypothetical protein